MSVSVKCNGLDPCLFCTENRLECSYSREPRRRGPPSGYLRYTETRVALFEVLLGLFLSRTHPASDGGATSADPFYETVKTLVAESTTCTQDVWDGHRRAWTVCRSAKMIDDLAMTLSPYSQRPDQEVALKPLLPPVHPGGAASASGGRASAKTPDTSGSPPLPPTTPPPKGRHPAQAPHAGPSSAVWPAPGGESASDQGAVEYPQAAVHTLSRESFERNIPLQPSASNGSSSPWHFSQSGLDASEYSLSPAGRSNVKVLAAGASFPLDSAMDPDRAGGVGQENPMVIPGVGKFDTQDANYEGSYW